MDHYLENIRSLNIQEKHAALKNVATQSGIWAGDRKYSHAFLLSPSVYSITETQKKELEALGHAINDCLLGMSHMANIAYNTNLNYKGTWAYLRKIFSSGVPKIYHHLQGMNVRDIPKLIKVDFMVDENGHFKIAEIDGHNKHGLGYSTLAMQFKNALHGGKKSLPGVVKLLAENVVKPLNSHLALLYAHKERFYLPEFEIAAKEFEKHGVSSTVLSEKQFKEQKVSFEGLYLDFPFLSESPDLSAKISRDYQEGKINFIIPPKPFLGAKSLLALLRNDGCDEDIEAMLKTFIKKSSLELVRKYIPQTFLVGKNALSLEEIRARLEQKSYVLKESISSGMKGTVFSDNYDFEPSLVTACNSNQNWILQEEVFNQPQEFSWFEECKVDGPYHRTEKNWFMRVTVQYVNRSLGDIIVTARQSRAVHGAKDSIQLGAIVIP